MLTLARIVYSAATGRIAAKDAAAAWVLERLPREHRSVVQEAKDAYVSGAVDRLAQRPAETTAFVHYTKAWIRGLLGVGGRMWPRLGTAPMASVSCLDPVDDLAHVVKV